MYLSTKYSCPALVLVHCNDCVCVEMPCKFLQHCVCVHVFMVLYIAMIVFVSRHHASIYNMVLVHCNDCVCVEMPCKYLQHGACTL